MAENLVPCDGCKTGKGYYKVAKIIDGKEVIKRVCRKCVEEFRRDGWILEDQPMNVRPMYGAPFKPER
jgi:hypothetical protein